MVDAITSYNANKPTNSKKDLTINWNKLTVKEIKEYEGEGQEVPEYIKKWAEYVDKLQNTPDDVTYATYFNSDANAAKYNSTVHTALNDPTTQLNMGANPSASTEAGVYQNLCKDTLTNVKNVTDQLDQIMKQAEKVVTEAGTSKDGICDRIQQYQQRITQLKNDKKDPLAPMEMVDLFNQIQSTGESGVSIMDMKLLQLQGIGTQVTDAYDLLKGAGSLTKTAQTLSKNNFGSITSVLKYSKELNELSKNKKKDLQSATKQQDTNEDTIEGYRGNISTSIGMFSVSGADNTDANTNNGDGTGNDESTAKATAKTDEKNSKNRTVRTKNAIAARQEKEKTLADEKILTDPNEILKRKQKRGEA